MHVCTCKLNIVTVNGPTESQMLQRYAMTFHVIVQLQCHDIVQCRDNASLHDIVQRNNDVHYICHARMHTHGIAVDTAPTHCIRGKLTCTYMVVSLKTPHVAAEGGAPPEHLRTRALYLELYSRNFYISLYILISRINWIVVVIGLLPVSNLHARY